MTSIEFQDGNLLNSSAQTLVNTVNCVGVMGKGIALAFKQAYPEMFDDYARRCRRGEVRPGTPYLYRPPSSNAQLDFFSVDGSSQLSVEKSIINFPTKDHWRSPSRLEWVDQGLEVLTQKAGEWGLRSLAIPALGCGNGGLDWEVVGPMMIQHLDRLDLPVTIYVPAGVDAKSPFSGDTADQRRVA